MKQLYDGTWIMTQREKNSLGIFMLVSIFLMYFLGLLTGVLL